MTTVQWIILAVVCSNILLAIATILTDVEIRKLRSDTAMRFASVLDMYQKLKLTQEETNKAYDRLIDIYRGQTTMYTNIYEQHVKMIEGYNMMVNQHEKLLECWDSVEKRYSQSYEQFMHVNKQLSELNPVLKRIINDRTYDRLMDIYRGQTTMCAEHESESGMRQSLIVEPVIPDPEYEPVEVTRAKETNFVTEEKMEKIEEFLKEENAKKPRKSRKKEGSSKDVQAG